MQPTDHDLLVRIDERVGSTEVAVKAIRLELRDRYVTNDSFEPVKRIVYAIMLAGLATLLGGAVILSRGV